MLSLTIFMIIHINYVKLSLTKGFTAHDCGGPYRQVPTLRSPKYSPGSYVSLLELLAISNS